MVALLSTDEHDPFAIHQCRQTSPKIATDIVFDGNYAFYTIAQGFEMVVSPKSSPLGLKTFVATITDSMRLNSS